MPTVHEPELLPVASLRPHPRNYRDHPDAQLDHVVESIQRNGVYKNVVCARDGTILAGHGVVLAAQKAGVELIRVVRLDLDPDEPAALKVLAGDNEVSNLAVDDDRKLTELLREIAQSGDLLGTGYDAQNLAALAMVTRPAAEIKNEDEAAHWVGMPKFSGVPNPSFRQLQVHFKCQEDVDEFAKRLGIEVTEQSDVVWFPKRTNEDLSSVVVEGDGPTDDTDRDVDAPPVEPDEGDLDSLDAYLARVRAVGVDARRIGQVALATIKSLRGDAGNRTPSALEQRWYASLAAGSPDYSVYADDDYLAELWACWYVYSRAHMRNLARPGSLDGTRSVVDLLGAPRDVVDLGCGIGYTTAALRRMFPQAHVVGTNLSGIKQTDVAQAVGAQHGFAVAEWPTDVEPGSVVLASEYFEHFDHPLVELARVLDGLAPRALVVANAFGAKSIGHFDAYHVDGASRDGAATSRAFGAMLRQRGYVRQATKLWNSRPSVWTLAP